MGQKVSLVLSGGGARGIAHIGVIEELEKQGCEIFSISGTSMGALVGGVYALGKMEEFKNWLYTLDKLKVFGLVDFSLSTQGLIKGDKVLNTMKDFIPDSRIEDLGIYYTAVAADVIKKKEVTFTEGSIYDAIRASIAIPSVITPVKTEDGLLVDGGVLNNIPVSYAKRISGDILVVVNVNADIPVFKQFNSKKERETRKSVYQQKILEFYNQLRNSNNTTEAESIGYFDLINKTIGMMKYRMAQMVLEKYSPDILVNVPHDSCGTYDFYRAEEMVEMGKYAARKSFGEYKKTVGLANF